MKEQIQTTQLKRVNVGTSLEYSEYRDLWECTECGDQIKAPKHTAIMYYYCPYCGRMIDEIIDNNEK